MKKHLIVAFSALLLSTACTKNKSAEGQPEQPLTAIPAVPAQESQAAITGQTANNNGIVYTQLNQELSYNKFITVDVNSDGKNDLYFTSVLIYHDGLSHLYLTASPVSKNGAMLQLDDSQELVMNGMWAKPLEATTEINNTPVANAFWSNFMVKGVALDVAENSSMVKTFHGPWVGRQDKYLAMRIKISNGVHYGWVRISHSAGEQRLVLTGYAYNTIVGESIRAGQTLK